MGSSVFHGDSSVSEKKRKSINGKDLEDTNLLQEKSLKLEKIMNEKMSKRRIQITDLQKQESEERRLMHLVPAPAVRLMKRQVLSSARKVIKQKQDIQKLVLPM